MVPERIDIPTQDLYDGLEDGLWERTFTLPVDGISFSVAELDQGFRQLRAQIGDAAFEQVIAEAGIQRGAGDTFSGVHGLPLDFLVRGGCLFVLAIGERSAGRYRVALQGAWRIA